MRTLCLHEQIELFSLLWNAGLSKETIFYLDEQHNFDCVLEAILAEST